MQALKDCREMGRECSKSLTIETMAKTELQLLKTGPKHWLDTGSSESRKKVFFFFLLFYGFDDSWTHKVQESSFNPTCHIPRAYKLSLAGSSQTFKCWSHFLGHRVQKCLFFFSPKSWILYSTDTWLIIVEAKNIWNYKS